MVNRVCVCVFKDYGQRKVCSECFQRSFEITGDHQMAKYTISGQTECNRVFDIEYKNLDFYLISSRMDMLGFMFFIWPAICKLWKTNLYICKDWTIKKYIQRHF